MELHEIPRTVVLRLPTVFGVDLSITNEVLLVFFAGFATLVLLTLTCRRREPVARGVFQNMFEALFEFVDEQVVKETLPGAKRFWGTFLTTLFFFILFCNWMGLVPLPNHFKSATSSLSVTAALAAIVFFVALFANIRQNGVLGFLKKFLPGGVPWWAAPLIVPIEIVSWLAKPMSLAIRLCINMMVGHALLMVFVGFLATVTVLVKPLPLLGAVAMSAFEIFVGFIQALIFTLLAAVYVRDALEHAH